MDEEIHALQNNRTWIWYLALPTPTLWAPNGYSEPITYLMDLLSALKPALLPKATTVRVVLSLAVTQKWPLHQLDVKNAFLNGTLTDQVYMEQPPGYIDPLSRPCFRADTSLFVFHQKSDIIYLLLYVDDIIITATPTSDGLFISQFKYARDIFIRAQLLDSKLVHTTMVVSQHLSADGSLFSDPTLYRSLVGALQYLTITRPDIAHAINSVSQFLHAPTDDHFLVVKRIFHYVKGTIHYGLHFRPSTSPGALVAYSDADWADCPNTLRSTSNYSIYLGDNLVSWSAKKQPTVSCSSCESEYRALVSTTAELIWLTHLLHNLKVSMP
ncbi:uncharacterized protein LOC111370233 [Olea europaea var. sylvestris]|uniref:uncharacterized protein LOC111370233 n=1 Tax=Olea europaea var. sylvestris TaxID=158386 RepID=UPI000C1D511F|nr:uncharacterized protein LOC111370233 [Olea europaea var. sylvestris]